MLHIDTDQYERDGFLVLRGIFSGERLRILRQAAEDVVTRAATVPALARAKRLQLTDPRLSGVQPGDSAITLINCLADEHVMCLSEVIQRSALVANTYNLNVDSVDQFWHRDEFFLPASLPWDVAGYRRESPFSQIQWNLPLMDDSYFHIIPGSHRDAVSSAQLEVMALSQRDGRFIPDMPGVHCVRLAAGDGVVYNNNLVHGVRRPADQPHRRTLHWYWVSEGAVDPYAFQVPDISAYRERLHARIRDAYSRASPPVRGSRFCA